MNLDFENMNWNSAKAAGKNLASYVAGGVSLAVMYHFLGPSSIPINADDISTNINHVINGLEEVAKGIAGLSATAIAIYNMWKSAHNATPKQQAVNLEKAQPGTVIITDPEIAKNTPDSPNIISNTEVKIVPKGI